MKTTERYAAVAEHLRNCADLGAALSLLEWDQETYMPAGAGDSRAQQIGALSELLHERQTDPKFLESVDALAADPTNLEPGAVADVREIKWRLDRERALSGELVRERAEQRATARSAWIRARQENDFAALAPHLERLVAMERRVAACIDAQRPAYEVLLEGYEPGLTLAELDRLLTDVRTGSAPLVERIRGILAERPYPASVLHGHFPKEAQRAFNRDIVARIGFDFDRGRIDESAHPFSISIGGDVRLTTRYDERNLTYSLYSSLHEAGHGMYEQGLAPQRRGMPRGSACSLGVHESQSRLWENQVGRCAEFWEFLLPKARLSFPGLANVSSADVLLAANRIEPSLIRTEADELTYNFHILVRYDLERALIAGDLAVRDLPAAWSERIQAYLGVVPPDDRTGVLQDVHWSAGEFGYFPTYTLGNIYAAQLFAGARRALGEFEAAFKAGDFAPLLAWLRTHVHRHGQEFRAATLVERATGRAPAATDLLAHLEAKVDSIESALRQLR